jgi:hypothetical protein
LLTGNQRPAGTPIRTGHILDFRDPARAIVRRATLACGAAGRDDGRALQQTRPVSTRAEAGK